MSDAPGSASRDDGVTAEVRCLACGRLVPASGRRRFCSPACRQRAYRRRKGAHAPLALAPARSARADSVYECPDCQARYLGEQRCPDCNRFCARVGAGGACPHCDEPVALADLVAVSVAQPRPRASRAGGGRS